jgi:hypothetical protein
VQAFYTRAAAHQFDSAWAVAGPGLRGQLNGYDAFRSQFSSVRSITFGALRAQGSTVTFSTTATHTDHVDHCTGSAQTTKAGSGGYVVDHIAVSCR